MSRKQAERLQVISALRAASVALRRRVSGRQGDAFDRYTDLQEDQFREAGSDVGVDWLEQQDADHDELADEEAVSAAAWENKGFTIRTRLGTAQVYMTKGQGLVVLESVIPPRDSDVALVNALQAKLPDGAAVQLMDQGGTRWTLARDPQFRGCLTRSFTVVHTGPWSTGAGRLYGLRASLDRLEALSASQVDLSGVDPDDYEELKHEFFDYVGQATSLVADILSAFQGKIPHDERERLKKSYAELRRVLQEAGSWL